MNRPPAFQFYAGDWLRDENVMKMTLEQRGAYITLIAICWQEGSIPADIEELKLLFRVISDECLPVVLKRFILSDELPGRMVHKRLDSERATQAEWREKSRLGGKKSAAIRRKNRTLKVI